MSSGGNLPKTVSSPPEPPVPPSTGTHSSWFVLERGHILLTSSTLKQLHLWVFPPLLCLFLFLTSRNDSNPSLQESVKTQKPKNPFVCLIESNVYFAFCPSWLVRTFLTGSCCVWIQCRLWGCPVKQTHHAWIQASGVRIWRSGQVGSGEYSFLKLCFFFVQFLFTLQFVFLCVVRCTLLNYISDFFPL